MFAALPKKRTIGTWVMAACGVAWLAIVALGQRAMLNYDFEPATSATAPAKWPANSKIPRSAGLPSIVVMAHPRCPCTRATIEELALLMTRLHGQTNAAVVFVRPPGVSEGWVKTDLWRSAVRIPGVTVTSDVDGLEAALFGTQASGQTLLYSVNGDLQFNGGITASRGHSGDNLGRSSIVALVTTGKSITSHTSVYGCSLHNPERAAAQ
jgi:hypothetical protein